MGSGVDESGSGTAGGRIVKALHGPCTSGGIRQPGGIHGDDPTGAGIIGVVGNAAPQKGAISFPGRENDPAQEW